jgi:hypothetical protein
LAVFGQPVTCWFVFVDDGSLEYLLVGVVVVVVLVLFQHLLFVYLADLWPGDAVVEVDSVYSILPYYLEGLVD